MSKPKKLFVAGKGDVAEKAIVDHFSANIKYDVFSSTELQLDLLDQDAVRLFFLETQPDYVVCLSTRSGGIAVNQTSPAEFIHHNLQTSVNVIHSAFLQGVEKFLYMGASCSYPKEALSPISPSAFLSGPLELSSQPYAVSKMAGVIMAQAYRRQYKFPAITAIPATVYGPYPVRNLEQAHVMGALISRFQAAVQQNSPSIEIWGTGYPRREFIYSEDYAHAVEFLLEHYNDEELINIGVGDDISIKELAEMIKEISGYKGRIVFDTDRPDGAMQKLLDTTALMNLGWAPHVSLYNGISAVLKHINNI